MYIKSPINSFFNLYHLKKYIKDIDGFISGGCFKNVFKHQKIRDIDIFFRNQDDFDKAVKFYSSNYKKMFENDNCIAFSDHKNGMQIELVRSIFGTPEEITDNFDFTIVKASLVKTEVNKLLEESITQADNLLGDEPEVEFNYEFIYHDKFFEHLLCNKLVIDDKMPKSVATFNRVLKYTGYGFGLCRESKIKLVEAIKAEGNSNDINGELYFGFD